MNTSLPKLKELAQAAQQNQYDPVALNDYGMAVSPEIERHRLVEAEGCKPEISNRPIGDHSPGAQTMIDTNPMVCLPRDLLEEALDAAAAVGMQDVASKRALGRRA